MPCVHGDARDKKNMGCRRRSYEAPEVALPDQWPVGGYSNNEAESVTNPSRLQKKLTRLVHVSGLKKSWNHNARALLQIAFY
jgi:hypothetical protein